MLGSAVVPRTWPGLWSPHLVAALLVMTALPLPIQAAHRHFTVIALFGVGAILLAILELMRGARSSARFFPNTAYIALTLIAFGLTLGLLKAGHTLTAVLSLSHRIITGALILLMTLMLRQEEKSWGVLGRGAVLTLLLHAVAGGEQLLSHGTTRLVTGIVGHANVFAMMLALLLPWAALVIAEDRNPWWRAAAWFALLGALAVLPFTRSAGAALALAAGWGVAAFRRWRGANAELKTVMMFITSLILGGTVVWLSSRGEVAVSARAEHISSAWSIYQQNPFTGRGPGQFIFDYPAARSPEKLDYTASTAIEPLDHVHLEPLHTALEGGLSAAVGLILLMVVAGLSAWRLLGESNTAFRGILVWVTFATLLVQGAISLAPTRQAMLPAALALAAAFASIRGSHLIPVRPLLLVVLIGGLISALPVEWRRIRADMAYHKGRNWEKYWEVRNPEALREAIHIWPEELESRSLLLSDLYAKVSLETNGSPGQKTLLSQALAECDTLDRLAPQYFKTPLIRARILLRLKDPRGALHALNEGDRFAYGREFFDLQERVVRELEEAAESGNLNGPAGDGLK